MTSIDFDASLRHTFIILHVLFIAGAAGYIHLEQYNYAIFFGLSSIAALLYYQMFQNRAVLTRLQAHLNLIDQAITDSEEFREGVRKKGEAEQESVTVNLADILADKNTEEVQEYIEERLKDDKLGDYGGERPLLEAVKEAEAEGLDRLGVKHFVTEKILENVEKRGGEQT